MNYKGLTWFAPWSTFLNSFSGHSLHSYISCISYPYICYNKEYKKELPAPGSLYLFFSLPRKLPMYLQTAFSSFRLAYLFFLTGGFPGHYHTVNFHFASPSPLISFIQYLVASSLSFPTRMLSYRWWGTFSSLLTTVGLSVKCLKQCLICISNRYLLCISRVFQKVNKKMNYSTGQQLGNSKTKI